MQLYTVYKWNNQQNRVPRKCQTKTFIYLGINVKGTEPPKTTKIKILQARFDQTC